jgi:hypothetical protein
LYDMQGLAATVKGQPRAPSPPDKIISMTSTLPDLSHVRLTELTGAVIDEALQRILPEPGEVIVTDVPFNSAI